MARIGVGRARDYLYSKYGGLPPDGGGVSNFAVDCGLRGYLTTRTAAEQFTGSFRVDIAVDNEWPTTPSSTPPASGPSPTRSRPRGSATGLVRWATCVRPTGGVNPLSRGEPVTRTLLIVSALALVACGPIPGTYVASVGGVTETLVLRPNGAYTLAGAKDHPTAATDAWAKAPVAARGSF